MRKMIILMTVLMVSEAWAANGQPSARVCKAGVAPLDCRKACDAVTGTWNGTTRECTAVWGNVASPGPFSGSIKQKNSK